MAELNADKTKIALREQQNYKAGQGLVTGYTSYKHTMDILLYGSYIYNTME